MSSMNVRISVRTDKATRQEYFEGTVELAGLKPTKLAKNDGCTQYSSRSQVTQAANRLGQKLSLEVVIAETGENAVRQAAKKSVKKSSAKVIDDKFYVVGGTLQRKNQ